MRDALEGRDGVRSPGGKVPSLALPGLLCALPPLSIDMGLPALAASRPGG